MACPFMIQDGRYQVYATTKATDAQYYRIYAKLCTLMNSRNVYCDIVSTGSSDSDAASLITNCGGLIPLFKSSDLQPVTVAQLPAGTSINVVVKSDNMVPQGIVMGL